MAESLYVCEFSNGHIKVGRSTIPQARIAQHADRVACMGVLLVRSYITECPDAADAREQRLINACVVVAKQRHQLEWFVGLNFDEVCRWAYTAAHDEGTVTLSASRWQTLIGALRAAKLTQADIASFCGCDQTTISALYSGRAKEPLHSLGEKLIALHTAELSTDSFSLQSSNVRMSNG